MFNSYLEFFHPRQREIAFKILSYIYNHEKLYMRTVPLLLKRVEISPTSNTVSWANVLKTMINLEWLTKYKVKTVYHYAMNWERANRAVIESNGIKFYSPDIRGLQEPLPTDNPIPYSYTGESEGYIKRPVSLEQWQSYCKTIR